TDALMRELNARPPQEPPLVALRNALHASITRLVEEAGDPAGDSVYLSIMKLIEGTPSLLAAHLRYMHERDDEIARVLAEREGVDPIADLRPRCVAAVFSGLFITANREWRYAGGTVEAMLATFDACADQVATALAGHWRLPAHGVYAGLVRVGCRGAAAGPATAAAPRVHGPGGRRGGGRHPGGQRGRVRRDQVRPAPARGSAGPPRAAHDGPRHGNQPAGARVSGGRAGRPPARRARGRAWHARRGDGDGAERVRQQAGRRSGGAQPEAVLPGA